MEFEESNELEQLVLDWGSANEWRNMSEAMGQSMDNTIRYHAWNNLMSYARRLELQRRSINLG